MLRQLRRLTRPVSGAGPEAHAIAVYAEPGAPDDASPLVVRAARERGFEGVACVDDAARAVVLYCGLWRRYRAQFARSAAYRLLRFLAYMQDQDGRFVNFVFDWTGQQNGDGCTSYAGGPPWQARALHALACAVGTFGQAEWDARFRRAVTWLDGPLAYLDVRAVGVLAVLEHWRATGDPCSAKRAIAWCGELAAHTRDDRLLNAAGEDSIHLWGHLQEAALADAGRELGRPELVVCARASAEALLVPLTERAFDAPHVLPFEVSCTVAGLSAVGLATGERHYLTHAALGRKWFFGRNTAQQAVYNGRSGLVYDGIDDGQVSRNSGAESNIEAGLGLLLTPK